MTTAKPFTDPTTVRALYLQPQRIEQRTRSLKAAKVRGPDAATSIARLVVAATTGARPTVIDLGCGRGSTTNALADALPTARLIALDLSPGLLAVVRRRLAAIDTVCADLHELPFAAGTADVVVAAFCLYHSVQPRKVIAEIARCLGTAGRAILVTKSADSYVEIDQLISASQLDPRATHRPSLYTTFNTSNAARITATVLRIERTLHQDHAFLFSDFECLAGYVSTSPKYQLLHHVTEHPAGLADELKRRLPEQPVLATSTVTYVVAAKPIRYRADLRQALHRPGTMHCRPRTPHLARRPEVRRPAACIAFA